MQLDRGIPKVDAHLLRGRQPEAFIRSGLGPLGATDELPAASTLRGAHRNELYWYGLQMRKYAYLCGGGPSADEHLRTVARSPILDELELCTRARLELVVAADGQGWLEVRDALEVNLPRYHGTHVVRAHTPTCTRARMWYVHMHMQDPFPSGLATRASHEARARHAAHARGGAAAHAWCLRACVDAQR